MTGTFLRMVVVAASLFLPSVAAAESAERCRDLPADGGDCGGYFVKWTYTVRKTKYRILNTTQLLETVQIITPKTLPLTYAIY